MHQHHEAYERKKKKIEQEKSEKNVRKIENDNQEWVRKIFIWTLILIEFDGGEAAITQHWHNRYAQ